MIIVKNKKIFLKQFSVIFLSVILLFSFPLIPNASAVGLLPDSQIQISDNDGISNEQQIISSGTNVYVVWKDTTSGQNEILFLNSTNNGTSFASASINLSSSSTVSSTQPQVAASGNNVFAVWKEGNDIFVKRSTDNGSNFSFPTTPSDGDLSGTGTSLNPQVESSGSNVYVVWKEGNDIFVKRSTNNGVDFVFPTSPSDGDLSGTSGTASLTPDIAVSGSNVYVVWKESNDIFFARSTDSGNNFSSAVNISGTGTASNPQIEASGNNVYVVWRDGTDILFKRSTSNGSDLNSVSSVDLGNRSGSSADPQMAISGSGVYVVWRDSSEIKLARSTNDGQSFSVAQNLSNNAGTSRDPNVASTSNGNNVYVTWRDNTSGNNEVLLIASDDMGATFGDSKNLSENTGGSRNPQIAASGSKAFVVWDDPTGKTFEDVLFRAAIATDVSFSFDQAQYALHETVNLTIDAENSNTNSGSVETIDVTITSTTDTNNSGSGISVTLTETGADTGSFTKLDTFTFSETQTSDASDILLANAADTITASFSGKSGTVTIFDRTIVFLGGGGNVIGPAGSIDFGEIAGLRVTDKNSNTDPNTAETITVNVISTQDSTGINLSLTETGINTDVFGGTSIQIGFMDGNDFVPKSSTVDIFLLEDTSSNTNPSAIDKVTASITPDSNSGISFDFFETSVNSANFTGTFTVSPTTSIENSTVQVADNDFIEVAFDDFTFNLLVTPHLNTQGAISVNFPIDDTVTAKYKGSERAVTVFDTTGEGGGGGGLVRPGLVVNVLAGAVAGGGGLPGPTITLGAVALSDRGSETISLPQEIRDFINDDFDPHTPLEPIADIYEEFDILEPIAGIYEDFDLPLSINGISFALGGYENTLVPQTIEPGKPTEFTLVFYTTFEIAHTSLNFNLGPTRTIAGSDTQVLLYKDKFEIIDPNGNIATATGSINNEGDLKRVATFSITFSEDIQWSNSDLVIRSWNDNFNSGDIIVYDAIQVLPSEEEIAFEQSLPEPEVEQLKSQYVPIWIKNNAAWWSQQLIEDSDFVAGIEYLIQNEIITIQDNQVIASSYSSNDIPEWIKNNAGWWSEDLITEKEFIDGLQWLISNGIIQVTET